MRLINASKWHEYSSTHYCYYGSQPNAKALWDKEHFKRVYHPFASVRFHLETMTITAIRDHFGCEPFYFTCQNDQFIFGSFIQDILSCLTHPPKKHKQSIKEAFFEGHKNVSPTYTAKTIYEGIFRLNPGHSLTVTPQGYTQKPYWLLDPDRSDLLYRHEADYKEHFRYLLHEAVAYHTTHHQIIGVEYSGGYDSTSILANLQKSSARIHALSHCSSRSPGQQESASRAHFQNAYPEFHFHDVGSKDFDLFSVMEELAPVFAGASPYLYPILANNIHRHAKQQGCTLLLSGFGGDECVSNRAPKNTCWADMILNKGFIKTYRAIHNDYQAKPLKYLRALKQSLMAYNKTLYILGCTQNDIFQWLHKIHRDDATHILGQRKLPWYPSLPHYMFSQLQGSRSHHIRMRIEYSALVAKKMGFQYAYPLLYPPLVEFCFQLPSEYIFRNGQRRYLMKQFYQQILPTANTIPDKFTGQIMPATIQKSFQLLEAELLKNHLSKSTHPLVQLIHAINQHMFELWRK